MLSNVILFGLGAAAFAVGTLVEVTNFGSNPTSIQMFTNVPAKLATKPAVVIFLHGRSGNAQEVIQKTTLVSDSENHGFILISPQTKKNNNCWDVNNPASLTHGQGGDAGGIVSMANYTLSKYGGDSTKVYVAGSSSGAMMTNVLAGSYPDVFAAGAAYSGVPFGCFAGAAGATPMSANQSCAQGLSHTAADWGNFVRTAYPGYAGKRTKMMLVHGTADTLVKPACMAEELKQWSNVLGVSFTKNNTGVPSAAYTNEVYGDGTMLQAYIGAGVGHPAPIDEGTLLKWFGIMAWCDGGRSCSRRVKITLSNLGH